MQLKRSGIFLAGIFVSGILLAGAALSAPAHAMDRKPIDRETRETVNSVLGASLAAGDRMDSRTEAGVLSLLESYRLQAHPASGGVADAPYPGFVLSEKIGEIYTSVYETQYKEQFTKIVDGMPLELLLDAFMQQIVDGTVGGSAKEAADKIGKCLARKVLKAAGPRCVLDPGAKVNKPGLIALLLSKASCTVHIQLISGCAIRKAIYNAAKPELLKARQDPETRGAVAKQFAEKFPLEFRKSFLAQVAETVTSFPGLLARKFDADPKSRWISRLPLIESSGSDEAFQLQDFTDGFRADLRAAAYFAQSKNPEKRALAAGLFYAAANRLLLVTGGRSARILNGQLQLDPAGSGVVPAPLQPPVAPKLLSTAFGGWAFDPSSGFGNWDWAGYSANPKMLLFPSVFELGPAAVPVPAGVKTGEMGESLQDLAGLLGAAVEFLRLTRPEGPLGSRFGDSSAFEKVIDPQSPMIFPNEGRQVAIGVIAAILKNLLAPGMGHLELPGPNDREFRLVFHERITAAGRSADPVTLLSLGRLMTSVADLRDLLDLGGDPAVPAELLAAAPQLGQALQVAALVVGSDGQAPDGTFFERLGVKENPGEARLVSATQGLMTLTRAYNKSRMLALRLSIRLGWEALDRDWKAGVLAKSYLPSELWALLRLWEQTQIGVRADLAQELDWHPWETRMNDLRERLIEQVQSEREPAPTRL